MPKKLPEKEHSGTLKNSELFPKIQLQMQYYKLLMVPDYHPVPPRCLLSMQILNPSNGCMGDHKGRQSASHFSRFSGHPEDRTYCPIRPAVMALPSRVCHRILLETTGTRRTGQGLYIVEH
jgi:hypothetical protein